MGIDLSALPDLQELAVFQHKLGLSKSLQKCSASGNDVAEAVAEYFLQFPAAQMSIVNHLYQVAPEVFSSKWWWILNIVDRDINQILMLHQLVQGRSVVTNYRADKHSHEGEDLSVGSLGCLDLLLQFSVNISKLR